MYLCLVRCDPHHQAYYGFTRQEEALSDLMQLASQLPWADALEVWRMNNSLKKRRGRRRGGNNTKPKPSKGEDAPVPAMDEGDAVVTTTEKVQREPDAPQGKEEGGSSHEEEELEDDATKPLKFRVTCSRAGDKHSFASNEAARDFGGAVQEFFQWKADMTKFDVEV